ncbi:MAG: NADH-quinone oxidoreductase subunit H [Deltaproteobacteria bacterium]|nr:NADH-quinone oxidoreductase subunit H [Deltaproteobacteria bacterium]
MIRAPLASLCLPLVLAPLLLGVINRTKAIVAGRKGQPLLQAYFDLWKLLQKGAVYSRSTTWVFYTGPAIGLAALLVATAIMPFGGAAAAVAFPGDLILLAYLLGLARFLTVVAALDTASSFEGMGASREVTFSALAEPALLLALAALALQTGSLSLSTIYTRIGVGSWGATAPALALVAGALLLVFLTENARIPVDDPTTHLELTMIHEVMVLDHSGPDLAFIQYAGALKLWLLGSLIVGLVVPLRSTTAWIDVAAATAGMFALATLTGLIESSMARWRLLRVPQLLVGAGLMSALALVLMLR